MTNKSCPDCEHKMQTITISVLGGKDKYYQECPTCYFTADLVGA